jgi:4-hydroxy-4-methyl-2-oxoglutarate aldolase
MAGLDFESLSKELYTAVLSDILDEIGFNKQALRTFVRPIDDTLVLFGRARTGLFVDTFSVRQGENPYENEIKLIDDLKPGDIPILACNGPTSRIAPWGELLTTASMARGAVGCVTDGLVRDVRQIRGLRFPVFHGGIGPLDTKGRARMIEIDTPVECAGVKVSSGDLIFGDIDGVVVIPQQEVSDVIARAQRKVRGESATRAELAQGRLLREVYEKYGVP